MKNNELFEQVKDVIDRMDGGELVYLWNEYCDAERCYDDRIENMEDLPELFSTSDGDEVFNLLNRFYFGHDANDENSSANPNRDYFIFNGYGNIVTSDYPADFVDFDELSEYIVENSEDFGVNEIAELLNAETKEQE